MSDSVEKLILQFWANEMSGELNSNLVFAREPQDESQQPPYVSVDVRLLPGVFTNTGGYSTGELTFDLFHPDWTDGLNIFTTLKHKLENVAPIDGVGIRLDHFRLQSGSDFREPDGVRHFVHSYGLRIHHLSEGS